MESSQENDQLQKEANNIMRELLKTQENEQQQEPQYKPVKATTQVRQLFIGNLPFRVRWQDIKDLFRKAGQVLRADVALNHENRSKGHGTILFSNVADAQNAIDMFNGYKWQGRILEVRGDRGFVDNATHQDTTTLDSSTAATMSPKTGKEPLMDEKLVTPSLSATTLPLKKQQAEVSKEDEVCKQLFVGNLPFNCQWQDLKDLFRNSGRIIRADVVLNFEGRSRGFGTVLFSSHEDAKKAIEKFNGYEYDNRTLRVHFDKFAASHQRFREHEAETFGQRQIHDPASVELLRQTYLPQQTAYQNMMGGYVNPSLLIPMQTASYPYQSSSPQPHIRQQPYEGMPPISTTSAIPTTAPTPAMYNNVSSPTNNLNNSMGIQPQQYSHNPFSLLNTAPAYNPGMMNDRQFHADNFGNLVAFNQYAYHLQWVPPHITVPPQQDYQLHSQQQQGIQQKEQETLSSTLERLSLSNNGHDSAGLNKDNDSSWNNMPVFREK